MSETAQRPLSENGPGPAPSGSTPAAASGGGNPWLRRIASFAVLVLAAGIFAYGCQVGESADDGNEDSVIVAQFPAAGGRALRQTEVGAQLEVGYDGRLTVNGIAIPEGQLEGAATDPRVIEQFGVRPNNRNRVIFRPGPGKVIESFEPGVITIVLRYFEDGKDDGGGRVATWTVTVT